MAEFIGRGALAGAFRAGDVGLACRMLFHGAHGLLDDLISSAEPIDVEAVTAAVLELAHRGLGAPEPTA
jgi:hypothetical protein